MHQLVVQSGYLLCLLGVDHHAEAGSRRGTFGRLLLDRVSNVNDLDFDVELDVTVVDQPALGWYARKSVGTLAIGVFNNRSARMSVLVLTVSCPLIMR